MHVEAPEFKRCCCCVPLRRGLIGFGYARFVLDILSVVYTILIITWLYPRFLQLSEMGILITMTVFLFVDIVFSVLLVVAGHMKNTKLFRVAYIYCIVYLVLDTAFGAYILVEEAWHAAKAWQHLTQRYLILDIVVGLAAKFAVFFVQVYIILLIRSEEKKLRDQSIQMQFVNNAAESEAICVCAHRRSGHRHNTVQRSDDEHDVMQNTDDVHDVMQYADVDKDSGLYKENNSVRQHAINKYLVE